MGDWDNEMTWRARASRVAASIAPQIPDTETRFALGDAIVSARRFDDVAEPFRSWLIAGRYIPT